MAIDTRQKRFSMMNMAMPHVYPILFEADSAVDADDRAFMLHLYAGITLSAPAVVVSEVRPVERRQPRAVGIFRDRNLHEAVSRLNQEKQRRTFLIEDNSTPQIELGEPGDFAVTSTAAWIKVTDNTWLSI